MSGPGNKPIDTLTTPTRANALEAALEQVLRLQSTPSDTKGSASHAQSGALAGKIKELRPWITSDYEQFKECSFDALLEYLLVQCVTSEKKAAQVDGKALLRQVLSKVLTVCDNRLVEDLTDYCKTVNREEDRYAAFVNICNRVLRRINGMVPGNTSKYEFLVHVNDPKTLRDSTGMGKTSKDVDRKPDIVICSLPAACGAEGEAIGDTWDTVVEQFAPKRPKSSFYWTDCPVVMEFKKNRSSLEPPRNGFGDYKFNESKVIPVWKNVTATTFSSSGDPVLSNKRPAEPSTESSKKAKVVIQAAPRRSGRSRNPSAQGSATTPLPGRTMTPNNDTPPGSTSTPPSGLNTPQSNNSRPGSTGSVGSHNTARKETDELPPPIQCGVYALEMMSRGPGTHRSIVLLFEDEKLWVWVTDREGVIQSTGIDFIQDFPRFAMLLFAFQRLSLDGYGLHPTLNPNAERFHLMDQRALTNSNKNFDPAPKEFALDMDGIKVLVNPQDKIHSISALKGRAGLVLGATSSSVFQGKSLEGMPLVVKMYWPDDSRTSETEILARIKEHADDPVIKDHVPELICSKDYDDYNTREIRRALGLEHKTGRVLRVMVFRRLKPITELQGDAFVKAWLDCVRCHYALWKQGIQHRDPSLDNLMYHQVPGKDGEDGAVYGVLNDWDLGNLDGILTHDALERTGTIPYMPISLLVQKYWDGQIPRTYEHDMESFVWILVWVFMRYNGPKIVQDPPLQAWLTGDWRVCGDKKGSFLRELEDEIMKIQPCWEGQTKLASGMISFVRFRISNAENTRAGFAEPVSAAPEDVYRAYWNRLMHVYPDITTWALPNMEE